EEEQKLIETMPTLKIPNVIFQNKGNFEYQRYTEEAGFISSYSNGAAIADLNNDGKLDLVVNNLNDRALILKNNSPASETNNWIGLQLMGNKEYPITVGSKATVYAEGKSYFKELITTRGFQSSSSPKLHFGLGKESVIDSVKIIWPNGTVQLFDGPALNQYHLIQRDSTTSQGKKSPEKDPEFIINEFPYTHFENTYFDYELEPLMPEKLSEEGPAVVVADFNS